MFGCLGRLGCLVVLLVAAALAWFSREFWVPRVTGQPPAEVAAAPDTVPWRPLADSAAATARRRVATLSPDRGYVALTPHAAASYFVSRFVSSLPAGAGDVQASVAGERLRLRTEVALADLRSAEILEPVRGLLGDREVIEVAGTLEVLRPGLAQYRVESMRIRELVVPSRAIPRLMRALWTGERPDGLDPNAIGIDMPADVGEIRIRDGQVILYRTVR